MGEKYEELYLDFTERHYGGRFRQMLSDAIRVNRSIYILTGRYASNIIMNAPNVQKVKESTAFYDEYKKYSERGRVIFYGVAPYVMGRWGSLMRNYNFYMPNYIWDINADKIGLFEGQAVTEPDWDMLDGNSDYMVILFLTISKNVDEVAKRFKEKGVSKLIVADEFIEYLVTNIKSDIYQKK